jgi:hypothetical protein
VIGLLATLFGSSSTIWSTVLTGCVGGRPRRAEHAAPPALASGGSLGALAASDISGSASQASL